MKKCPFCKAEIEDNARFCLYCMKPLEEKEVIASPKKKKRWWPLIVLGAVLLVILLCVLLAFGMGKEGPEQLQDHGTASTTAPEIPNETSGTVDEPLAVTLPQEAPGENTEPAAESTTVPTEDTKPSTEPTTASTEDTKPSTEPTTAPTEDTKPSTEPTTAPTEDTKPSTKPTTAPTENTTPTVSAKPDPSPEPKPAPCSHSYALSKIQSPTCTADGFNTYTCDHCGDSYQQTVAATGHQYAPANCLIPKVCKECSQMNGDPLGHSYSDGYCFRCDAPDYTDPKVVFEYREVGPNDYFSSDSYIPGSDIVITGVKEVSPDGVYEVPSYIDGKRVVGIMSLAFSGTDARKVVLGETIIRINQNAFSGCYNIGALYIRSDELFLSRSAFIDAAWRNCTLKIYCSANCIVDDDLYGECYLKDIVRVYGAEYEQWDG